MLAGGIGVLGRVRLLVLTGPHRCQWSYLFKQLLFILVESAVPNKGTEKISTAYSWHSNCP